ncbi:MAG: cytochrome c, partial [Chitinophagaceae bacterium]
MSRYRKIINKLFASFLLLALFSIPNNVQAQDGEALFKANCAACHKVDKDFTGPALQGWSSRVPDADWIYKWIASPAKMISSDPYSKELFAKWKPTVMTAFPNLKKEEIDAIMAYVDKPVAAPTTTEGGSGT